jgi:hypothetical protein
LLCGEVISIHVGKGQKAETFNVHIQLLETRCPGLIRGIEVLGHASIRTMHLLHTSAKTFEVFLSWLYQSVIGFDDGLEDTEVIAELIELCVFADRYTITELIDDSIECLLDCVQSRDHWFAPTGMAKIYEKVRVGCKLRLFIVRCMVYHIIHPVPAGEAREWTSRDVANELMRSKDLCCDVLSTLMNDGGSSVEDPSLVPRCDYHSHALDEACPRAGDPEPSQTSE